MALIIKLLLMSTLQASATDEIFANAINPKCLTGSTAKTKAVTHYMVPILDSYSHQVCDVVEGTCIYKKKNVQYIHNVGYTDVPLSQSHCKNGWGNRGNCIHPCRTLAASMKHHRFGQVVFMKALVGLKCGNLKRDGFEMVHDGYMVVTDTGSPNYFYQVGRFDFFWGRCRNQSNGECHEGAVDISEQTSNTDFCTVWDPAKPGMNVDIKNAFVLKVKKEAAQRGDFDAANDFQL